MGCNSNDRLNVVVFFVVFIGLNIWFILLLNCLCVCVLVKVGGGNNLIIDLGSDRIFGVEVLISWIIVLFCVFVVINFMFLVLLLLFLFLYLYLMLFICLVIVFNWYLCSKYIGISVFFNDDKFVLGGNVFRFILLRVIWCIVNKWLNFLIGLVLLFYKCLLFELWWEVCMLVLDLYFNLVICVWVINVCNVVFLFVLLVKFW